MAKIGLFCNSRQLISHCLGRYRPFFFCQPTYFVSAGPSYTFFSVGGRFLLLKQLLNNPWSNPPSSSDHWQTVCYVCRRLTFRHLKFSEMLAGRHWLTTENRQRVNWSIGRLWQIGWWTTVYGLRKNIYRLLVNKLWPGQRPHLWAFFLNKLKECPHGYWWIFSNCKIFYVIGQL